MPSPGRAVTTPVNEILGYRSVSRKVDRMPASRIPLPVVIAPEAIPASTWATYSSPSPRASTATRPVTWVVRPENPPRLSGTRKTTEESPGTISKVPVGRSTSPSTMDGAHSAVRTASPPMSIAPRRIAASFPPFLSGQYPVIVSPRSRQGRCPR